MDVDEPCENEEEFWEELDDIVSTPCRTLERIDDTLRTWIGFIGTNKESYVNSEQDVLRCSYALWSSDLFSKNNIYIRRQLVYCLLQEEDPSTIHLVSALLLLDGRKNDQTFELMNAEGVFPRLIQLIKDGTDDDLGLHRQLLEVLYEMSRIQQVSWSHLASIDDDFVLFLFRIIELHASDASDPHHYPVIRVLLVLNEQYMVSAHNPASPASPGAGITNRVIKVLSLHGHVYKTFGENLILLLNRESETSPQLLILKLLYLLFTTEGTAEYFYTNDLHVLVDILMRNLLDLPPPSLSPTSTSNGTTQGGKPTTDRTSSLRHTYLRVLHPLLANTQLRHPPHYKRAELRRMFCILADAGGASNRHFERPDETTVRLVGRCIAVDWLKDTAIEQADGNTADAANVAAPMRPQSTGTSEISVQTTGSDTSGKGFATVARKQLGVHFPEAQESRTSVSEVAKQKERPGVVTPSRKRGPDVDAEVGADPGVQSPFDD